MSNIFERIFIDVKNKLVKEADGVPADPSTRTHPLTIATTTKTSYRTAEREGNKEKEKKKEEPSKQLPSHFATGASALVSYLKTLPDANPPAQMAKEKKESEKGRAIPSQLIGMFKAIAIGSLKDFNNRYDPVVWTHKKEIATILDAAKMKAGELEKAIESSKKITSLTPEAKDKRINDLKRQRRDIETIIEELHRHHASAEHSGIELGLKPGQRPQEDVEQEQEIRQRIHDSIAVMLSKEGGEIFHPTDKGISGKHPGKVHPDQEGKGEALVVAVKKGDSKAVDILLRAGADPNIAREDPGAPGEALSIAATLPQHAAKKITKMLLDHGADPNILNQATADAKRLGKAHTEAHFAPLLNAVIANNDEVVYELLTNKNSQADPNVANGAPLRQAVMDGKSSIVKILIDNGAKANEDIWKSAHEAGSYNAVLILRPLFEWPDNKSNMKSALVSYARGLRNGYDIDKLHLLADFIKNMDHKTYMETDSRALDAIVRVFANKEKAIDALLRSMPLSMRDEYRTKVLQAKSEQKRTYKEAAEPPRRRFAFDKSGHLVKRPISAEHGPLSYTASQMGGVVEKEPAKEEEGRTLPSVLSGTELDKIIKKWIEGGDVGARQSAVLVSLIQAKRIKDLEKILPLAMVDTDDGRGAAIIAAVTHKDSDIAAAATKALAENDADVTVRSNSPLKLAWQMWLLSMHHDKDEPINAKDAAARFAVVYYLLTAKKPADFFEAGIEPSQFEKLVRNMADINNKMANTVLTKMAARQKAVNPETSKTIRRHMSSRDNAATIKHGMAKPSYTDIVVGLSKQPKDVDEYGVDPGQLGQMIKALSVIDKEKASELKSLALDAVSDANKEKFAKGFQEGIPLDKEHKEIWKAIIDYKDAKVTTSEENVYSVLALLADGDKEALLDMARDLYVDGRMNSRRWARFGVVAREQS